MKLAKVFIFISSIFLSVQQISIAQDVPFVPTSPKVVNGMLTLAQVGSDDVVYDLGCGDGRIVVAAAKDFGARGIGVDSNPQRIQESNQNAKSNNVEGKVKFIEQNLFEADIKDATVIAIYLLNSVNLKLRPKLLSELKPGTRVVSHAFDMDDWEADAHEEIDERDIYLWIIPANASGTWNNKGDKNYSFQLDQEFQKISGIISTGEEKYNITEGKLKGNEILLKLEGKNNSEMEFNGTVEGDKLSGSLVSEDGSVNEKVSAERQKGTKKQLDKSDMMEVK